MIKLREWKDLLFHPKKFFSEVHHEEIFPTIILNVIIWFIVGLIYFFYSLALEKGLYVIIKNFLIDTLVMAFVVSSVIIILLTISTHIGIKLFVKKGRFFNTFMPMAYIACIFSLYIALEEIIELLYSNILEKFFSFPDVTGILMIVFFCIACLHITIIGVMGLEEYHIIHAKKAILSILFVPLIITIIVIAISLIPAQSKVEEESKNEIWEFFDWSDKIVNFENGFAIGRLVENKSLRMLIFNGGFFDTVPLNESWPIRFYIINEYDTNLSYKIRLINDKGNEQYPTKNVSGSFWYNTSTFTFNTTVLNILTYYEHSKVGNYSYIIQVIDNERNEIYAQRNFTINVQPPKS